MKTNQENCEGIDQAPCGFGCHMLAKNRAVGQRELKVFGNQHSRKFFTKGIASPGDDCSGEDGGSTKTRQVSKELIFAVCDAFADFLDRDDPVGKVDETDDVARDAARKSSKDLRRPVFKGDIPR